MPRCAGAPGLNFVGNVEGFAIGTGAADVIVADGFTGNVALKVMEGSSAALLGAVAGRRDVLARSKAGGMLLRPALRGLRDDLDPRGAGRRGPARPAAARRRPARLVRRARLPRAIELAARGVRDDVAGRTHARLAAAGALRRASEAAASVPDQS